VETLTAASKMCANNPCFNEGICTENGCICSSGYAGIYCETLIGFLFDDCES